MIYIIEPLEIAVISYVITVILQREGYILSWWHDILCRLYSRGGLVRFVIHPLGLCELCMAGQVALWYHIVVYGFHILPLMVYICNAIILTETLKKIYG